MKWPRKDIYIAWRLALHNLIARYRNSLLGFFWSFTYPCVLFLTYYVAFQVVLKTPFTDKDTLTFGFSIFFWYWIAQCLSEAPLIFITNRHLLSKVPLKVITLTVSAVLAQVIHFLFTVATMTFISILFFGFVPAFQWALMSVVLSALFFCCAYVILGTLNVFFRDIQHLVTNLMTPLFFFTPVIYDFEKLDKYIQTLLLINPLTSFTLLFKNSVTDLSGSAAYFLIALSWLLVNFSLASFVYKKLIKKMLDRL
ncbi:MAG: ABC transporter permease [Deltaproteobacteria bacterium]|nr:ABC transporter permease [Deltaproteobacteria bacterium]